MSLNFVQGDTAPELNAFIHQEDDPDQVLDLTGCSVRFQMRKQDDKRYTVDAVATILDAPTGSVSHAWGANDLAVPGTYVVQWEVTHPGGRIQTTAPEPTITVRRQ